MTGAGNSTNEKSASYQIRALDRGLDVLEAFSLQRPELGIAELATLTSIPKPTIVRMLSVLSGRGYVERDADTDRYRLGARTLEVGSVYLQSTSLEREARPIMAELAAVTNQTANLGVLQDFDVVHIEVVAPDRPVRFWASVGSREAAYLCGLGKVLLAVLDVDALDAYLKRPRDAITATTITDAEALRTELAQVNRQGFAFNNEESHDEVRCIAAPVRDGNSHVIAKLGVTGAWSEFGDTRIGAFIRQVMSAADSIAARLCAGAPVKT